MTRSNRGELEEEHLVRIVYSALMGEDFRKYELMSIHDEFIRESLNLFKIAWIYKKCHGNKWLDKIISDFAVKSGEEAKRLLMWFTSLNEKTVRNIAGSTKKEVIVDLGKQNLEAIKLLVNKMINQEDNKIYPLLSIKFGDEIVKFTHEETLLLFSSIATMKLTIQGGRWSRIGILAEKALLYTLFKLLKVPESSFILDKQRLSNLSKVMKTERDVDGVVINNEGKYIKIEVKLLGIGNPEISDEAIARQPDLFITDQSTDKMEKELRKKGIFTIVLRKEKFKGTIKKLEEFFKRYNVVHDSRIIDELDELDENKLKEYVKECVRECVEKYKI